jgi:type IV pilus assembly protein PilC
MMWKVIPVFANIYSELGATLPGLTAMVLAVSRFVSNYIALIFIGIVGTIVGVRLFRNTPKGRKITDTFLLRMPLFGSILEKVGLSRITRTLSTLLSGGVPMLESMKITSSTSGNVIIENSIMRARTMVAEGTSLTDSLKSTGRFPFMFVQMVGVGEATGTLDEMLAKLADFYDEEVDSSVSAMLSVLEPILLIFVGGIVGVIIVSMYLPIFTLLGTL